MVEVEWIRWGRAIGAFFCAVVWWREELATFVAKQNVPRGIRLSCVRNAVGLKNANDTDHDDDDDDDDDDA